MPDGLYRVVTRYLCAGSSFVLAGSWSAPRCCVSDWPTGGPWQGGLPHEG